MAKIGKNIVINGLRGKLRNLIIFRRQGNKTFTYLTPEKRTIPWSAAKKTAGKTIPAVLFMLTGRFYPNELPC